MPPNQLQFDGEPASGPPAASSGPLGLTGFVVRWGLANDKRQAQTALVIIFVVVMVVTIGLFLFGNAASSRPSVPNISGMPRTGS